MGILQHEQLFGERSETQQQANGDKTGDQWRKNGGELREEFLHATGLFPL